MKIKNIYRALFLLFVIQLFACESIVDVDLPKQESKIVVNSFFTPDSSWKVNISKSLGIFDNSNIVKDEYGYDRKIVPEIANANVEIWEDEVFVTKLEYTQSGFYTAANIYPEINKSYQLKVNAANFHAVSATNSVPKMPEILDVKKSTVLDRFSNKSTELKISFIDQENVRNFYNLRILLKSNYGYSYEIWFESNDVLFSGEKGINVEGESSFAGSSALFDDAIFDGKKYSLSLESYEFGEQNDRELILILTSISKEMFLYLQSIEAQRNSEDNPFSEPTFIHGNIEGGLGIFGGYNSSYYKVN